MLDVDSKTFVMHMAIWEREEIVIDLGKKTKIEAQSGAQVGALLFDKAPTEILAEHSDYSNVFSAKNAVEFLKNNKMNKYAIKLEKGKQPSFGLIYSLNPMELKTLKTYIKINLANDFIQPFKSPAGLSFYLIESQIEVSASTGIIGVLTI